MTPPLSHSATIVQVDDQHGRRCVVTEAAPVIWIGAELVEQARNPNRQRSTGDLEIDGDLVHLGTPGEGLGRLTYHIIEYRFAPDAYIAEQIPAP